MVKHVPLRTCVQCNQVRPKRGLVRLVRTPGGEIEIDARGKAPGRGAYLCRNQVCWENALARDRLDHALKCTLRPEDKQRLLAYAQGLPRDEAQSAEAPSSGAPAGEPVPGKEKGTAATLES